jgi:carboxyl-terminal processing protease
MRFIRSNKAIFFALVLVWVLAGTAIFNYSYVNAQTRASADNESFKYLRLFSEVVFRVDRLYVEEVNVPELINFAVNSMVATVDTDSTFILSAEFQRLQASNVPLPPAEGNRAFFTSAEQNRSLRYFGEMVAAIKAYFGDSITYKQLIESAIDGMISELDVHTNFFTPDDFKDFTSSTMGEFGGLGIHIDRQGDYVTVVSPMEGTPAYKMGILAGDKIVSVDEENVVGMATDEVIKRMRGDKGTKVLIGIQRHGVENVLLFEIVRDIIKIKSVSYAFKLDNGVGYVRVRQFNANTTNELRVALDQLEREGIRGLLIDLRFNGGGLLGEAVDTVNEFIGPGRLVVSSKGRIRESNSEFHTRFNRSRSGYPVVVLINEASASASEIFAGSLQDWDRGLVAGRTSFGKGTVQQLYGLSDGYGLKITISKYYIKSGRSIHKDFLDRILRGQNVSVEEMEAIEKENREHIYYTVNGREVRGGGGIVPDVRIDQKRLTQMEIEMRRLNLFFDFTMDYYNNNRDSIQPDFRPDEAIVANFLDFAVSRGLEFEQADVDSALTFITLTIAKDVIDKKFGELAGYKVAIPLDTQLTETISLFDRFPTQEAMFEYAATLNYDDDASRTRVPRARRTTRRNN